MKNILLLENSKTIYIILSKYLNDIYPNKFSIELVKTHKEFIEKLHSRTTSIDIIFSNRGVNNINLIKALNQSKHFNNIPIVLLTTDIEEEIEENTQINEILGKPFTKELLKDTLDRL